jgi:hypothetical protein
MKQFYSNTTAKTVFIGGKMIAPGITREVDVIPEKTNNNAPFDYAALLAAKVKDLPDLLEPLNLEQLEGALTFEHGNSPRKTAIEAIESAIDDLKTNLDLSEFAAGLSDVEDLDELSLKVSDNAAKVAMIAHEITLREEQNNA